MTTNSGPNYNSLSRRAMLTFSTAAGLTTAYGIYAALVDPLLTPAAVMRGSRGESRSSFVVTSPRENVEMADRYLAAHPWAAQARYQLRTQEAFIYFNEWEPVESDEAIRFRPFAMIWRRSEGDQVDEQQVPVTIACESSYVRFANSFSISNPDPGRVVGGSLEGNVQITGPDGLQLIGRNFVFSEEALGIWSDHHVDFAYGDHRGEALGLQVELIRDTSPGAKDALAVSGMRSIQLRRNVTMELLLEGEDEDGDSSSPKQSSVMASLADGGSGPTHIKVQSAGSFHFSSIDNIATFEENVRVARPTGPSTFDTLQCDRLTLTFVPDNSRSRRKKADKDDPESNIQGLPRNLAFRQMLAEGRAVVLKSQENNLSARMTRLEHDAKKRKTTLQSPDDAVHIQQGLSLLHCPEVTLQENKEGVLETITCNGAGQLQYFNQDTNALEIAAAWKKRLRKRPATSPSKLLNPETGKKEEVVLDMLDIEEDAILQRPQDQTALAASFIRFWVDPREPSSSNSSDGDVTLTSGGAAPSGPSIGSAPQLQRLLARDNVGMISPQMQAECDRLEVWFETEGSRPRKLTHAAPLLPPAGTVPAQSVASRAAFQSPQLQAQFSVPDAALAQAPSFRPAAIQPPPAGSSTNSLPPTAFPATSPAASTAPATAEKPPQPIMVAAETIRVRVVRDSRDESRVAEVFTEGQVRVTQFRDAQTEPLEITGDRLHLVNASETEQLVHVFGNTAHIRDRKAHIEGREIHLDRAANRTWVTGEGLLQLPVNRTLEGEPLETERLLDIWWKEEMTFDGQTARFFGDVRTVLEDTKMTCQDMQVTLSRKIHFGEEAPQTADAPQNGDDKLDVESVVCKDGVQVESFEYRDSRLIGVRHARFWQFTLDQRTGDSQATGPGWITFWRRGEGKRAGLTPTASVQANRPLQSDDADWEYTRIDFNRGASGNVKQRFTTFNDRVQIVYGPVKKPMEIVDPDQLPKDGGWMRCNSLQLTHHSAADDRPAYIEMLGDGNAELEGRSFNARADAISYDESKGLYTLRSLAPRKATIWQQKKAGGEYSRAEAQRMEFIPARNQLKLDQATGLDGIQ